MLEKTTEYNVDTFVLKPTKQKVIDYLTLHLSNIYIKLKSKYGLKAKKSTICNDQEMAQSERNSHSINPGVGKN